MSYVIQNYYQPNFFFTLTEKISLLIKCYNIIYYFFSFKFSLLTSYTQFLSFNRFIAELYRYRFMFYTPINNFESQFFVKSNISKIFKDYKSYSFYALCSFWQFFNQKSFQLIKYPTAPLLALNGQFLSSQIIFNSISWKTYKIIFFFFLLNSSFMWPEFSLFFKLNTSFVFFSAQLNCFDFVYKNYFKVFNF